MNQPALKPPIAPQGDLSIAFDLTVPVTKMGFGPFAIDPVAHFLGAPLIEILDSLLRSKPYQCPGAQGVAVDVFPLMLPEGEGASIDLAQFGEIGLANEDGLLRLTVPQSVEGWVGPRFGEAVVSGPMRGPASNGGVAVVSVFHLRLQPGMKASLPLGMLGEVGVEAACLVAER